MNPTAAPRAGTDWRAILLLLYNLLAMLVMLLGAAITGLSAMFGQFTEPDPQNFSSMILAGGLLFGALLLVPGTYYSGRRVFGMRETRAAPMQLTRLDWLIFLLGWPLILLISEWLLKQQYGWLIAPAFTAVSVLLPIWFLVKLGAHGLPLESHLRSWGTLSAGVAFTPVLIIIVEAIVIIGLLILLGIAIGVQPGAYENLQHFVAQLKNARTEEQALNLMLPYATNPLTVLGLLSVFSIMAPIVEESLKTSILWLIGRRAHSPAEGFVLGLLCGAGFTIIETIGSSSSGLDAWSAAMLTRFGSDLIHIVNGGLMGWAIVSAVQEKRYWRLLITLISVVLIHGLWNACTVFVTIGALYLEQPGAPTWSINAIAGGAGGLLTLAVGNLIVLALSNRRLRASLPPPAAADSPAATTVIESATPLN